MRSELDRRMDEGLAMLTGAGAPLALGTIALNGVDLPLIATGSSPRSVNSRWCWTAMAADRIKAFPRAFASP